MSTANNPLVAYYLEMRRKALRELAIAREKGDTEAIKWHEADMAGWTDLLARHGVTPEAE
jgi:hypothetical protein